MKQTQKNKIHWHQRRTTIKTTYKNMITGASKQKFNSTKKKLHFFFTSKIPTSFVKLFKFLQSSIGSL